MASPIGQAMAHAMPYAIGTPTGGRDTPLPLPLPLQALLISPSTYDRQNVTRESERAGGR